MTVTGKPADLSVDELGQGITEALDSLRSLAGEKHDTETYHIVNRATALLEELAGRADMDPSGDGRKLLDAVKAELTVGHHEGCGIRTDAMGESSGCNCGADAARQALDELYEFYSPDAIGDSALLDRAKPHVCDVVVRDANGEERTFGSNGIDDGDVREYLKAAGDYGEKNVANRDKWLPPLMDCAHCADAKSERTSQHMPEGDQPSVMCPGCDCPICPPCREKSSGTQCGHFTDDAPSDLAPIGG